MKVVFLDCDGVLNHVGCDWSGSVHPIDANCVSRVRGLRERTGAKIVLSSVWRLGGSGRAALEAAGLFVDSITPDLPGGLTNRAIEIRAWLEAHPQVTRWAVLDDEEDADLGDGSFFKTEFDGQALTEAIAGQVEHYLLAEQPDSAIQSQSLHDEFRPPAE